MRLLYIFLVVFSLGVAFSSCNNTKYLSAGQVLYTGATVKFAKDSSKEVKNKKALRKVLVSKTRPKPNSKILGMRLKLTAYNIAGEPRKKRGIRSWIRNKVGEPPVLLSQVNVETNVQVLQSFLSSIGYLQANANGEKKVNEKENRGKVVYTVSPDAQYKIRSIFNPIDSSNISSLIRESKDKSVLKEKQFYNLELMKLERSRIDDLLKQQGYFYFDEEYILFKVDSTIGNHEVNIYLAVKQNAPLEATKQYLINEINIYPNFSLQKDSLVRQSAPTVFKDFKIYDTEKKFRPRIFRRLILFSELDLYKREKHATTLNRIVNIGVFKFVKAEFSPVDTFVSPLLNANFYLTPLKKKSLSFEITGTSKSNNFVGSELKISHRNRNAFGGAEQFIYSLSGGFEKAISSQQQGVGAYSLLGKVELILPRMRFPFFDFYTTRSYVPKTHYLAEYQLLNRANFYALNSVKAEFGYKWKQNQYVEHTLNPLAISLVQLLSTTDSFNSMLNKIPSLRKNFERQFIVGTTYNFNFQNQMDTRRRHNYYLNGNIEAAGNLIGAFIKKNASGEKRLFDVPINQYARAELDARYYRHISRSNTWANRVVVGVGFPYGNNRTLPFIKQFFAGGSSDIRAFRARSLGPGFFNINKDSLQAFAEQGGDIKLMLNSELRMKLFSIVQGAVFVDAGNVWLSKNDPLKPGAEFNFKNVWKEMAVGAGVGIRFDATIFLIRFDLAMPLRKPFLPSGEKWVIDDINFGSSNWRRDNLILNIGIGYPF